MTDQTPTQPPYLEMDDLVRIKSTGALAFIERLGGDTTDDEETDDDTSEDSITDSRGRLIRWYNTSTPHLPHHADDAHAYPQHTPQRPLISAYDDVEHDAADNHESETRFPDTPLRPQPSNDTNGIDVQNSRANGHTNRPQIPDGSALLTIIATGDELLLPATDLELLDRSLDPGQLVLPAHPTDASFPSAQTGVIETVSKVLYVRRICDITSDTVMMPDPRTCFHVPAERLAFFSGIRGGDTVVRGVWVGAVHYFQEDVYVQFPDGAIACVPGHNKALQNVDARTPDPKKVDPFSEGQYYPGQRVKSVAHVWNNIALWIRGAYSGVNEGIVKSVKVGDVGVDWVAKSMHANDGPSLTEEQEMNTEVVRFSDITPLEAFRHLWWTVGDRGLLLAEAPAVPGAAVSASRDDAMSDGGEDDGLLEDDDDDDGEWEEDLEDGIAGPSMRNNVVDAPARSTGKSRSRRQGGRLMKAQRRARERNGATDQRGTVTDAALAHASADPRDVVQVVGSETSVVVLWQDGTRSSNVSTLKFRIKDQPESYDFWPGDLVVKNEEDFGDDDAPTDASGGKRRKDVDKQRGALVRVNPSERTAVVRWQNEAKTKFEGEEEVSVYELRPEDTNMAIGDTVLHIPKDSSHEKKGEKTADGTTQEEQKEWVGTVTGLKMGECRVAWHGGRVGSVPFSELLSIHGDDDGSFESGSTASDGDQGGMSGMFLQGRDSAVPSNLLSAFQPNWGPEADDDVQANDRDPQATGNARESNSGVEDAGALMSDNHITNGKQLLSRVIQAMSRSSGPLNLGALRLEEIVLTSAKNTLDIFESLHGGRIPREWRGAVTPSALLSLAGLLAANACTEVMTSSLQGSMRQASSPSHSSSAEFWADLSGRLQTSYEIIVFGIQVWITGRVTEAAVALERLVQQLDAQAANASSQEVDKKEDEPSDSNAGPGVENGKPDKTENGENENVETALERFSLCDELQGFHSFSNEASSSSQSHPVGFAGIVRKEWARLRKNLPPGMWVRACENRHDRLRATIVGPKDTPYADVLFFFDIWMGYKYPVEAPSVWFHSHGRRLNPNLYEDGKVCLSILGTWDGDDVESWDPATSNLLRVLLSLQALVFVDEPYYNEAGYMKLRGSEECRVNAQMYNESAFLLSMKHLLTTLRSGGTPKDCSEIAVAHYRQEGPKIVERCRELVENGGEKPENQGSSSDEPKVNDERKPYSSAGFRKSLAQLLDPLQKAFSSLGAGTD